MKKRTFKNVFRVSMGQIVAVVAGKNSGKLKTNNNVSIPSTISQNGNTE